MDNLELLAAISAMIEPMKEQLCELQKGQSELRESVGELQESVGELQDGLSEVRSGVNALLEWSEGVGEKFSMPLRPAQ